MQLDGRHRRALHVSRPVPLADEEHEPLQVVNTLLTTSSTAASRRTTVAAANPARSRSTRPDVATQVRFRKEEEMRAGATALRADGFKGEVKVLTSCPSCMQGLKRYNDDADMDADYIVVRSRARARRGLAAGVRASREQRRHRASAGLKKKEVDDESKWVWLQWRLSPRRRAAQEPAAMALRRHRALRPGAGGDAGQRACGLAQAEAHPGGRLIPGIAEALQSAAPGVEVIVANPGEHREAGGQGRCRDRLLHARGAGRRQISGGSSWSRPASRIASRFLPCASATSSSRTCSASADRSSPSMSWAWCWRSFAASTLCSCATAREWRRSTPPGRMEVIDGKTMLVVGLGGIGSEVAKRAMRSA